MRRLVLITAVLSFLLPAGAFAAGARPASNLLTNARITQMLRSGVSESTIIDLIKQFPDRLDDSPEALVRLRSEGASSRLLLALRGSVLAARRKAAAGAEEEPAAQAGDSAGEAAEEPDNYSYGPLSLGAGYPFIALKYDRGEYSGEARFISYKGLRTFALRGYWNFYEEQPLSAYTGLEAGYVSYGSGGHSGSARELSPFLGLAYAVAPAVSFTADVSPSLVFLPGGGTDSGFGKVGWYVNLGVSFRFRSPGGAPSAEEEESGEAAPAPRAEEEEAAPSRRRVSTYARVPYEEYLADAEDAISQRNYRKADQVYARALEALPEDDDRRALLYERRGWLAGRLKDYAAARDFYFKAVDIVKRSRSFDTTAVKAYGGLGSSFEKLGNDALAIKYYQRALDICADENLRREIAVRLDRLRE